MVPRIEVTEEQKRQAWEWYARHPEKHLPEIAAFLNGSMTTFARWRAAWGWPPRHVALAQNALNASPGNAGGGESPHKAAAASVSDAARALAQATRAQINTLMEEQRIGQARDHDKTARRLASYAKTLAAARALLEQEGSRLDDSEHIPGQPGRSIHELRDELAHYLDRVIAEEEARGRDGLLV